MLTFYGALPSLGGIIFSFSFFHERVDYDSPRFHFDNLSKWRKKTDVEIFAKHTVLNFSWSARVAGWSHVCSLFNRSHDFIRKIRVATRTAVRLKQAEKFVNCCIRAMIGIPAVIRNIPASFPGPSLFRNLLVQLISTFEAKFEYLGSDRFLEFQTSVSFKFCWADSQVNSLPIWLQHLMKRPQTPNSKCYLPQSNLHFVIFSKGLIERRSLDRLVDFFFERQDDYFTSASATCLQKTGRQAFIFLSPKSRQVSLNKLFSGITDRKALKG